MFKADSRLNGKLVLVISKAEFVDMSLFFLPNLEHLEGFQSLVENEHHMEGAAVGRYEIPSNWTAIIEYSSQIMNGQIEIKSWLQQFDLSDPQDQAFIAKWQFTKEIETNILVKENTAATSPLVILGIVFLLLLVAGTIFFLLLAHCKMLLVKKGIWPTQHQEEPPEDQGPIEIEDLNKTKVGGTTRGSICTNNIITEVDCKPKA